MGPISDSRKAGIKESVRNNLKTIILALALCGADHRMVYTLATLLRVKF